MKYLKTLRFILSNGIYSFKFPYSYFLIGYQMSCLHSGYFQLTAVCLANKSVKTKENIIPLHFLYQIILNLECGKVKTYVLELIRTVIIWSSLLMTRRISCSIFNSINLRTLNSYFGRVSFHLNITIFYQFYEKH